MNADIEAVAAALSDAALADAGLTVTAVRRHGPPSGDTIHLDLPNGTLSVAWLEGAKSWEWAWIPSDPAGRSNSWSLDVPPDASVADVAAAIRALAADLSGARR